MRWAEGGLRRERAGVRRRTVAVVPREQGGPWGVVAVWPAVVLDVDGAEGAHVERLAILVHPVQRALGQTEPRHPGLERLHALGSVCRADTQHQAAFVGMAERGLGHRADCLGERRLVRSRSPLVCCEGPTEALGALACRSCPVAGVVGGEQRRGRAGGLDAEQRLAQTARPRKQ